VNISGARAVDYSTVTEAPGNLVSREAIDMLAARYTWAAEAAAGKDVLEVACGAGPGLGLLARNGRRAVGGDYTDALLRVAQRHYGTRVPLIRLDASRLPFRETSFDVVLLFEAIYYLPSVEQFLAECRRVLRPGGRLLVCTVNRAWRDFNPSPYSVNYLDAPEMRALFTHEGFDVELLGAFPATPSAAGRVVSLVKRVAVGLHLIPSTMKGKELLKRMFLGPLEPFPAEVEEGGPLRPQPLAASGEEYKVLYVDATVNRSHGVAK
jgi:SAM-dependent methyltransferase